MPHWRDFLNHVEHSIGRLYGAVFLILGIVFLYLGGRGLLGYRAGVRAEWTQPLAWAVGLIAGVLSLWVGARVVRNGVPTGFITGLAERAKLSELEVVVEQMERLERTDPVAARRLLDDYFTREEAATERRRTELRRRSGHELNAAITLRDELLQEIKANARFRKVVQKEWPDPQREPALAELDALHRQLQSELRRLDDTIDTLRLK